MTNKFFKFKKIDELYDAEYYIGLREFFKEKPLGKYDATVFYKKENEKKFDWNLKLLIRVGEYHQQNEELIYFENLIIKRKVNPEFTDREYYDKLWMWAHNAEIGSHELAKIVTPAGMDKFMEHIKFWIHTNEFRVFDFYLEFSDDYKFLNKKPAHIAAFETLNLRQP